MKFQLQPFYLVVWVSELFDKTKLMQITEEIWLIELIKIL